jgi:hypothetical protein
MATAMKTFIPKTERDERSKQTQRSIQELICLVLETNASEWKRQVIKTNHTQTKQTIKHIPSK